MRQGRCLCDSSHNLWNHGCRDFADKVTSRGGWIGGGHNGAYDGDAIESFGWRAAAGDDWGDIRSIHAANANGWNGAMASCGEGGENLTDASSANDGFRVFLPIS